MFKEGRIGIFGDSLSELGHNVNNKNIPMIWSQTIKLKHPEYEFMVDAIRGRMMESNSNNKKALFRNGSDQLEPFIRNTFPCKKIIIFLGTNDIFSGISNSENIGTKTIKEFEKTLVKFRNLLFNILDDIYKNEKPKIFFVTTHNFNFKKWEKFNNKKLLTFENYHKINEVYAKLKKVEIIDISKFESGSNDGVHFLLEQQDDFCKIVENNIF